MTIYAGNIIRITTTITALDPPGATPTAVVCITTADGTFVERFSTPTVTVNGSTVTVVADWEIPDEQAGGIYIATVDTGGSLVAADQKRFTVTQRVHTEADPHT